MLLETLLSFELKKSECDNMSLYFQRHGKQKNESASLENYHKISQ